MKDELPERPGISKAWRPGSSFVRALSKTIDWPEDGVRSYISRADSNNRHNITCSELLLIGNRLVQRAWLAMFKNREWKYVFLKAIAYQISGWRLSFYWHYRFRILFFDSSQPLRMFHFVASSGAMADAFFLGQFETASFLGFMTHAALNRSYQSQFLYEEEHKRGDAFMLRLFADWQGFSGHRFPSWAYDTPIYEGLLRNWRSKSVDEVAPWLLLACDRHTHESRYDTSKKFYDFSGLGPVPREIIMVLRLRQTLGLENPVLDHPLMAAPFDRLPEPIPPYEPDELMLGCLKRAREDWPDFDEATSLEALRAAAIAPTAA